MQNASVKAAQVKHPTPDARLGQHTLDRIGNTPLLRLERIGRELPGVRLLGKAEWMNPGGSVKDRAAASIVAEARRSGKLGAANPAAYAASAIPRNRPDSQLRRKP